MGKNQHVVRTDGGWGVRGEGNSKLTKVTSTQGEAIEIAKGIAQNQESEMLIHGKDGKIRYSLQVGTRKIRFNNLEFIG